jgi:hypothetical protein
MQKLYSKQDYGKIDRPVAGLTIEPDKVVAAPLCI